MGKERVRGVVVCDECEGEGVIECICSECDGFGVYETWEGAKVSCDCEVGVIYKVCPKCCGEGELLLEEEEKEEEEEKDV